MDGFSYGNAIVTKPDSIILYRPVYFESINFKISLIGETAKSDRCKTRDKLPPLFMVGDLLRDSIEVIRELLELNSVVRAHFP